jgi:hypothetical protein
MSIPYLNFGLDLAATVAAVTRLVQRSAAPITMDQLQSALQPAVESFEATFHVTLPRCVVEDVCKAAVDAVNKYVVETKDTNAA